MRDDLPAGKRTPAGAMHPWLLFAYPFRVFFLAVAAWAVLAVPLWLALLLIPLPPPLALPALAWHQHEFLFGLLYAAVAGFLLTAVCVWTQTERLHGTPLLLLSLLWLAGRLVMLGGGALPPWLVQAVNLAFLPVVMLDAGRRILGARQYRQLVILVVLGLLWCMHLGFLRDPGGPYFGGALLVAMALMLVIGGRITPAFSTNWLRAQGLAGKAAGVRVLPALEAAMPAGLALLLVAWLAGAGVTTAVVALLMAAVTAVRIALWRGWHVRTEPLLWSLHLSLSWIPVALLLLGGGNLGWWPAAAWVHAAGVGAMAGLILGVISRVVLGHTGRPLELPRGMTTAFVLIHVAALLRVITALGLLPWMWGVPASAVCWTVAFALFLWRYAAILMAPRPDGRPG